MLVLATGLGKTTCFAEVLRRRRDAGRGRGLVLAHRIELVTQAQQRIEDAGLSVEVESGDRMAIRHAAMGGSDVVVATVQTLRGRRLSMWPADAFGTIVIDEAHHAAASGYRAVLDHFRGAKVLGVTATPDRGDGIAVGQVIPHLAYNYGIREGIRDGFLAPLRVEQIDTPSVDLGSVRVTKQEHGRDFSAEDLAKQIRTEAALHEIAGPLTAKASGRKTLVFCPSVDTAHELARVLSAYATKEGLGDVVRSLDGETDRETREATIAGYKRGEVRILVNCALFTEGFDAPDTSCIAIARPTRSRALWAQMVGRGTRLAEGKADCLVLDFAPENARHSLVSPVDLMAGDDLPEDIRASIQRAIQEGDDVLRAISRGEEVAARREAERARDRARANLVADVRYRTRRRDPFEELGIDGAIGTMRGPRATERQREALARAGIELGEREASIREASNLLDEISRRRKDGLCSLKQARALTKYGLRGDLTFADAREALDALAANGWRMSPEMAERWGDDA